MSGDDTLAQAGDVARALLGAAATVSQLPSGGRNSRIYSVEFQQDKFALKQYPLRAGDSRDRLSTEVGALQLMQRHGLETVPRVVGIDHERGYALLTWIDGSAVREPTVGDVDAALTFLEAVHRLRQTPMALEQPPAAGACLSGAEIDRQIGERLERLQALAGERELSAFLDDCFRPVRSQAVGRAIAAARAVGVDFASELPPNGRSLIPADFGFHNSLRRRDGTLAFIDFEYFGWDDPVKLVADTLLHPGTLLASQQRDRFRRGALRLYAGDAAFEQRLDAYLPLFTLRWILIILNEFVPEHWQRRVMSGMTESWKDVKASQLAKARTMLASLSHMPVQA